LNLSFLKETYQTALTLFTPSNVE